MDQHDRSGISLSVLNLAETGFIFAPLPETPKSAPPIPNLLAEPQNQRERAATTSFSPGSVKSDTSLIRYILEQVAKTPPNNDSEFSDRQFCRICHEGDQSVSQTPTDSPNEPLISPCKCSGSVGLIHRSCLEKWLSSANDNHCEICGHVYTVTSKAKPLKQWLFSGRFSDNHRNLTADIICFFILTPLACISAYLCAAGASHYLNTSDHKVEAIGLVFLASFLCLIYIVWITLSLRFHVTSFREWQKNNQEIRLVEVVSDQQRKP